MHGGRDLTTDPVGARANLGAVARHCPGGDDPDRYRDQAHRLESLGQLAGGVAHDLNNLLAVISNYTNFVSDDVSAAARTDGTWRSTVADLEQIRRATDRAIRLTHQLLTFGRRDVAHPQVLELSRVVAQARPALRRLVGDRVAVVTTVDSPAPPVLVDPAQLEQVLVNLAANARDAMPGGGTLTIETGAVSLGAGEDLPAGCYAQLQVTDTGPGMSEETLDRAFEPFFTTKPNGEGSGLGLSVVYGIVTQAGGAVRLSAPPGAGTTVTVLVPATERQPVTSDLAGPAVATGERRTVLVVDDEAAVLEVARRILARAGYSVLPADRGRDAIDLVTRHPAAIDLLVTDVVMPQMMGTEVADRIRALRPGVRVVFMSGYAQPMLAAHGTLDPGVILVEKPFTERGLLTAVRQALAEHGPETAAVQARPAAAG